MTKNRSVVAPAFDFRNFGVVLRCLILAEALHALGVLIAHPVVPEAINVFLNQGVLYEPVLLCSALVLAALSGYLRRIRYWLAIALVYLVVIALVLALNWPLHVWLPDFAIEPLGQQVLIAGTVTTAVLIYLNWRALRLSPGLAEAQLMALQARIRPHFLFNSLNSVLSLVREDPGKAERMLENLADLFRTILSDTRQLVTLAQEIAIAKAYLEIEGIRLGDRLRVDWHIDTAPLNAMVPSLVLQPLVENAVVHGIALRPEGGVIRVEAFINNRELQIRVINPRVEGEQIGSGTQTALRNIQSRLELQYDLEARLKAEALTTEYSVRLSIPIHDA